MEARETDKLFRDKLKNQASSPKDDSWNKLEAMLDNEEKAPWYIQWRAAAIGLLLIVSAVTLIIWNQSDAEIEEQVAEIQIETSEANNANNSIAPEIIVTEQSDENTIGQNEVHESPSITNHESAASKQIQKVEKRVEPAIDKQESTPRQAEKEKPIQQQAPVDINTEELLQAEAVENTNVVQDASEEPQKKKKLLPVRITYKRGNKPAQNPEEFIAKHKTDTTGGKLKEFFAQTREINPGDIWADIREAKHNLFQKKENSKKNNVKNLNK